MYLFFKSPFLPLLKAASFSHREAHQAACIAAFDAQISRECNNDATCPVDQLDELCRAAGEVPAPSRRRHLFIYSSGLMTIHLSLAGSV